MLDPTALVRELRLMQKQPNHRFYASCIVAVAAIAVPVVLAVLLR
jgi:hypothetical protein